LAEILFRTQDASDGFSNVDDVNVFSASIDVGTHFGIPLTGAVSEMDSRINQFLYQYRRLIRRHDVTRFLSTHSYGTQPREPPTVSATMRAGDYVAARLRWEQA
jgi:hypothetical protein